MIGSYLRIAKGTQTNLLGPFTESTQLIMFLNWVNANEVGVSAIKMLQLDSATGVVVTFNVQFVNGQPTFQSL